MTLSEPLRVIPGEGLGNRFWLVMRGDWERSQGEDETSAELACALCCQEDRDGVLIIDPVDAQGVWPVEIWNRDGSLGGTCLNGLRVVALWTSQPEGTMRMDGRLVDWTDLGDSVIQLHLRKEDLQDKVQLFEVHVDGRQGLGVAFWNPHAVFPVEDVNAVDLEDLARAVRAKGDLFPEGANVEVIAPAGEQGFLMRVDERGVGETASCGSGALAVALSAWAGGHTGPVGVVMRGGFLALERTPEGGIFLAGKASVGAEARFLG